MFLLLRHCQAFVSKANRLTVIEREERQRREQEEQLRQQHAEEQRKLETKHMVYAALAREDEAEDAPVTAVEQQQQQGRDVEAEDEMPDDTDGLDAAQEVCFPFSVFHLSYHEDLSFLFNHAAGGRTGSCRICVFPIFGEQYEDWKLRELGRIRRDKEEQAERGKFVSFTSIILGAFPACTAAAAATTWLHVPCFVSQLEAVERRRLMTAEERREDDKELDKMQPKREIRHKYHFMQKYYHRVCPLGRSNKPLGASVILRLLLLVSVSVCVRTLIQLGVTREGKSLAPFLSLFEDSRCLARRFAFSCLGGLLPRLGSQWRRATILARLQCSRWVTAVSTILLRLTEYSLWQWQSACCFCLFSFDFVLYPHLAACATLQGGRGGQESPA